MANSGFKAGGVREGKLLHAEKDILELDHASVGKEQRGSFSGTNEEPRTAVCPCPAK